MDLLYKQKYIKYKKKYTELKQQIGGNVFFSLTTNEKPELTLWGSGFEFVVQDEDTLLVSDKFEKIDEKDYGDQGTVGLYRVERTKKLWFIPNNVLQIIGDKYKPINKDFVKGLEIYHGIFLTPHLACITPDCTSPYEIQPNTKIKILTSLPKKQYRGKISINGKDIDILVFSSVIGPIQEEGSTDDLIPAVLVATPISRESSLGSSIGEPEPEVAVPTPVTTGKSIDTPVNLKTDITYKQFYQAFKDIVSLDYVKKQLKSSKAHEIKVFNETEFINYHEKIAYLVLGYKVDYTLEALTKRQSGEQIEDIVWSRLFIQIKKNTMIMYEHDHNFEIYPVGIIKGETKKLGHIKGEINEVGNNIYINITQFHGGVLPQRGGNMVLCLFVSYLYHLGYQKVDINIEGAVDSAVPSYKKQGFTETQDRRNLEMTIKQQLPPFGYFFKRCNKLDIINHISEDFSILTYTDLEKPSAQLNKIYI